MTDPTTPCPACAATPREVWGGPDAPGCDACGNTGRVPSISLDVAWPMPDELAKALVGLPNTGEYGQGIEAFNLRSFSDLDIDLHNQTVSACVGELLATDA